MGQQFIFKRELNKTKGNQRWLRESSHCYLIMPMINDKVDRSRIDACIYYFLKSKSYLEIESVISVLIQSSLTYCNVSLTYSNQCNIFVFDFVYYCCNVDPNDQIKTIVSLSPAKKNPVYFRKKKKKTLFFPQKKKKKKKKK